MSLARMPENHSRKWPCPTWQPVSHCLSSAAHELVGRHIQSRLPFLNLPGRPGQSRYDATPQPVYKAHDVLPFTLPLTAATQQNRSYAQM